MPRRSLVFLVVLLLVAGAQASEDLSTLLQKASDAFHRDRDPKKAADLYNQAVDAYPDNARARSARALFLEQFSGMVKPEARGKYVDFALQDLAWVAQQKTDEFLAGTARDSIRRLRGENLFGTKPAECPKEARAAYDRAEAAYGGGRFRDALPDYAIACEGCPQSANFWLSWADTHVHLGEDARAKELFEKAVAADPWNTHARRMLSRVEMRLGDSDAAFRSGAWAILGDPQSEASWSALRTLAEQTGRDWHRVYEQKPRVGAGANPGDTNIVLPVGGSDEPDKEEMKGLSKEERRQAKKERKAQAEAESATLVPWMTYSFAKALAVSEAKKSPLEIEREAIDGALQSAKESKAGGMPFWAMLLRAKEAGFLEEAMYLHLMDAQLAEPYRRCREAHADRLLAYLTTVLAPRREPKDRPGPADAQG
ncbi:MAG TPA: tetratricopeptide repeat protein [Candidatus Polarisedimenticolaceae bacterium]|nr:tetratricopeptide repeat protein [Candidatus Polarisedimenticolaceae bacterium]